MSFLWLFIEILELFVFTRGSMEKACSVLLKWSQALVPRFSILGFVIFVATRMVV